MSVMLEELKNHIANKVVKVLKIKKNELSISLAKDIKFGDFSLACFSASKILGKDPATIAADLQANLKPDKKISQIKAVGPYVNFFIDKNYYHQHLVESILKSKKRTLSKGKIMIEYSSPNPGKPFHIGHLRNTVLGASLVNLYQDAGYNVLSANYLNDTGSHIAKVLWIYLLKYKNKQPATKLGEWLGKLYLEANQLLEEDPAKKEEVNVTQRKLEAGDRELIALLKKFKKWSLTDFKKIYRQLNVNFDLYFYDSDYLASGKALVQELLQKNIARKSQGAIIVDLEDFGLGTALILKSDSSALYITKDLSMACERFKKYKTDRIIYVVGSEQQLHFKQVFKILELYGFEQAVNCQHVPYELVRLASGKISSRKGVAPLYNDIFFAAHSLAVKETGKRHLAWSVKKCNQVAEKIALAALKFSLLKSSTSKMIVFDLHQSMTITGDTGPYILYTLARLNSILKKVKINSQTKVDYGQLTSETEQSLLAFLAKADEFKETALKSNDPSNLANYLLELSHLVNHFYHATSVNKTKNLVLRASRLKLLMAVKKIIEHFLILLNIDYLKEM